MDLIYHQSVTDLFEQKIPLTKHDALQLCALRTQAEFGDYGQASHFDYRYEFVNLQFGLLNSQGKKIHFVTRVFAASRMQQYLREYVFSSVMRILPRHLRDLINMEEIPPLHKTLLGTAPTQANITFMNILRLWPLYGATMFDVTVSTELLTTTLQKTSSTALYAKSNFKSYDILLVYFQQTSIESLPPKLWLAVSQLGVHLMEFKGQVWRAARYRLVKDT